MVRSAAGERATFRTDLVRPIIVMPSRPHERPRATLDADNLPAYLEEGPAGIGCAGRLPQSPAGQWPLAGWGRKMLYEGCTESPDKRAFPCLLVPWKAQFGFFSQLSEPWWRGKGQR